MKRVKAKMHGRVQGVGFRYSAKDRANKFEIVGFVRNEEDGTVYIEAQGEEELLERFLAWCGKGPWLAKVDKVDVEWVDELGDFQAFEVL
jgi:acylphosphatase